VTFSQTHVVEELGASAWTEADLASPEAPPLDPGLAVEVIATWGDWAHVRCENGWETWTDGRRLAPIAATPATPSRGAPRTAWRIPAPSSSQFSVIVSIAAATAALGSVLPWYSAGGVSVTAFDIPLWALLAHSSSTGGISTGVVVVVCGLAAIAVWLRPRPRPAVLIALACCATNPSAFGIVRWLFPEGPRPTLGVGLVLSFVGGIIVLFAGWRALDARSRRTAP
jgi:hypothetical protein